jgi:hypothetical protein
MKRPSNRFLTIGLPLAMLFVASACSAGQADVPGDADGTLVNMPVPLTVEVLHNLEYRGVYEEPVKLVGGEYIGQPFEEGGASRPVVAVRASALGDLNQDGIGDAAVVLAENSGGSGTFIYLAAVVNRDTGPLNISTLLLGDRVQVRSIQLVDGKIRLAALTHGPQDPLCCPSQQSERLYLLKEDQLVPVETQ